MTVRYSKPIRRALLKWLSLSAAVGFLDVLTNCAPRSDSATGPPVIIPRAEWKAVAPDLSATGEHGLYDPVKNPDGWMIYDRPLPEVLKTVIIHHSALPLTDGPLQIQYKHMQQKGFADIGYHFVIDYSGRVYEGRNIAVRGAHTGGHNTGTVGVVLMGDFEEATPPPPQLSGTTALVSYLAKEYRVTHLAGHRDFQPEETVCPGKQLEALLPGLAVELDLQFGTAGYVGPRTP